MKFIIGKKLDMTQIWKADMVIAVTKVQVGPCTVAQMKTIKNDGYEAVQLGYGVRKEKNIKKPQKGHFKGLENFSHVREFRLGDNEKTELKRGDKIDAGTFEPGDKIKVIGTSKGKGFQGVVKRHGFHGQDKTHGTKDQVRMPGSIGSTGPQHVFKGVRMPGRMGGERVTTKNLKIVEVDSENNILYVEGSVPGAKNGLVMIIGEGELKLSVPEVAEKIETNVNEEPEAVVEETTAQTPASEEAQSAEKTEAIAEKKEEAINEDNVQKIEENN